MRLRHLILALALLIPSLAFAQGGQVTLIQSSTEPLPNCTPASQGQLQPQIWDVTAQQMKTCGPLPNQWSQMGGGSGGGPGSGTQYAVADWATSSTLGSIYSTLFGQILQAQNGAAPAWSVQGLPLGNGGVQVTSCPYTVQADTSTSILDRGTVLVFNSASACAVTLPDPSTTGMGTNFPVKMVNIGAGTVTVTQGTSATFTIVNGGAVVASGTTSFTLTTGQYITLHSDNTNWWGEEVSGGGLAPGTLGEPYVNNAGGSGAVTSPVFFDAVQFSGADASAQTSACLTAAGANTCNASGLSGSLTGLGTPLSVSTGLVLPPSGAWQFSFTGGTNSAVTLNDTGSIFTLAAQNRFKIQNASGTGGMKYVFNVPTGGYYNVHGITAYNPSVPTSGGAACNIASGFDGSTFDFMNCLDYIAGENSWAITGPCCSSSFHVMVGNGGYTSGVIAKISGGNAWWAHDVSWGHPAASTNVMTCSGSSTAFGIYGLYSEGSNADTTTPFYAINGCDQVSIFGNEVKAETSSSVAPIWTISNTKATSFKLEGFFAALNFTLPAIVLQTVNTTHCPVTPCNYYSDTNGNLSSLATLYSDMEADAVGAERTNILANGGTSTGKLAYQSSTGVQTITATSQTVLGICVAECGSSAAFTSSKIAVGGQALCTFDGNTVTAAGDYVIASQSIAGDCRDAGAARPVSGVQVIGQMTDAATGSSSGNQWVMVNPQWTSPTTITGTSSAVNTTPVTTTGTCCTGAQLQEIALTASYFNNLAQPFDIDAAGVYTLASGQTPTLTFAAKLCTVSGCGSGTVVTLLTATTGASTSSATNVPWRIFSHIVPTATGASGAFEAHGTFSVGLGASASVAQTNYQDNNTATVGTINLSGPLYLDVFVTTSTTNASNVVTQRYSLVAPAPATQPVLNWYSNGDITTTASFSASNILFGLFEVRGSAVSFSTLYYDVSTLDASNSYYLGIYSCPGSDCSQPSVTATLVCHAQLTVTSTGAKSTACVETAPIVLQPGTYILANTASAATALLKAANSAMLPFSTNTITGGGGVTPASFTTPSAGTSVGNTGRIALGLH
jgi:hypothetical protein